MSTSSRAGFTAIEMMVVVSIIIVLVAMVVPTIGPAMKKGAVSDAANAIQRACSQARQLARSTTEPRVTGGAIPSRYGVAVVVPAEPNKAAYAVVIYGNTSPSDFSFVSNKRNQYPNGTPLLDRTGYVGDGGSGPLGDEQVPSAKFPFSRNVMPMIAAGAVSSTTTPTYTLMSPGTAVGWYYHYRTGFVFQTPGVYSPPVDVGVPASGGATGTPEAFGVASLDMKYRIAVAIYKIGLLNSQDVN